MEKALKKEQVVGVGAAHNQTVRAEDESAMNFDDEDPAVIDDDADIMQSNRKGTKTIIEREPEREPEFEGNITHSVLLKENGGVKKEI